MIPKVIHYCWFGGQPLPESALKCIESWRRFCPDYEIKQWDESNYDINKNSYTKAAYDSKQWAFLTDYVRLDILYHHGGVYMDTDMQILKDITPLLENNRLICGYEDDREYINGAIIGVEKGHPFLKDLLEYYEKEVLTSSLFTIPKIMTHLMEKNYKKIDPNNYEEGIRVYDKEYFYPFGFKEDFTPECITENTFGIHWWGKSWAKKRNYFLESKHLTGVNKIWKCCKIFASNTLRS